MRGSSKRRDGGLSSFASLRESSFASLRMTESMTEGNPPPRLAKFASLICLGTPSRQSRFARCRDETPVQEGSLLAVIFPLLVQITKHTFLPVNPSKIPLLDRRGGSRPSEASVWRRGGGPSSFASLRMTGSLGLHITHSG